MKHDPVQEWVPLLPEENQLPTFVRELESTGILELEAPASLTGRKFYVTCRRIENPYVTKPVSNVKFAQMGAWAAGFTSAYILNILEEIPDSGEFIPVAYRDVRIAEMESGIRASGNMAVNRHFKSGTVFSTSVATALAQSDEKVTLNGVEVEGIYRGHGFGKLLTALELELLRQKGVQSLELPGVSDALMGILKKVKVEVGVSIDISTLETGLYTDLAKTFLPKK